MIILRVVEFVALGKPLGGDVDIEDGLAWALTGITNPGSQTILLAQ